MSSTTPRITFRTTMTVGTDNGRLTTRAVADAAVRSIAGLPPGASLDIFVVGELRHVDVFAFHQVSDWLVGCSDIVVHASGPAAAQLADEVAAAVEHEQRRAKRKPAGDPVLARLYRDMGDSLNGGA